MVWTKVPAGQRLSAGGHDSDSRVRPPCCQQRAHDCNLLRDSELLFEVAFRISRNIVFYLPRNVDIQQVKQLARKHCIPCEIERHIAPGTDNKVKTIAAYF